MYIEHSGEQSVEPVSTSTLRADSIQFRRHQEMFYEIFQRSLKCRSNSPPPKIELTGILIPLSKSVHRAEPEFKLETSQNEYLLRMKGAVPWVVKKLEWEEVIAKGYFDPADGVFEVEKISRSNRSEPYRLSFGAWDLNFDIDQYKKSIARTGMLDLAL